MRVLLPLKKQAASNSSATANTNNKSNSSSSHSSSENSYICSGNGEDGTTAAAANGSEYVLTSDLQQLPEEGSFLLSTKTTTNYKPTVTTASATSTAVVAPVEADPVESHTRVPTKVEFVTSPTQVNATAATNNEAVDSVKEVNQKAEDDYDDKYNSQTEINSGANFVSDRAYSLSPSVLAQSPKTVLKETSATNTFPSFATGIEGRARKRRPSSESQAVDTKLPSSESNKKARKKLLSTGASVTDNNSNCFSSKKPAARSLEGTTKTTTTVSMTGGGRRKLSNDRNCNNNSNQYQQHSSWEQQQQQLQNSYYVDDRDEEPPNENDPASARGDNYCPTGGIDNHHLRRLHHDPHEDEDDDVVVDDDEVIKFALILKSRGLEIVEQDGDGNCLFRAVSLQVYGDSSMHGEVRKRCLDFMARDESHFSQFITDEPFKEYILRKRRDGVHGNDPEIQAISELFNRPVEVFVPQNGATPLNIFQSQYKTEDTPIRLSYHDGNHYNAVIDPLVPTAGLGLGLPGLQPGLADKMQMAKAVAESDILADQMEYKRALKESQNDELQRAIKESSFSVDNMYKNKAIALSDMEATNLELEQAVLESSLDSFRNFEHGRKQASSSSSDVGQQQQQQQQRRRRQQNNNNSNSNAASSSTWNHGVASIPPVAAASSSSSFTTGNSIRDASVATAASNASSSSAVAAVPSAAIDDDDIGQIEYPETINELVMNGFDLRKVIHAYELIGDNFDSLLAFLMSTSNT